MSDFFQKNNTRHKAGTAYRMMFLITALYARCSVKRLKVMKPETVHLERSARYTWPGQVSPQPIIFRALFKSTCLTKEERCSRVAYLSDQHSLRPRPLSRTSKLLLRKIRDGEQRTRKHRSSHVVENKRDFSKLQFNDQWYLINPNSTFPRDDTPYFSLLLSLIFLNHI